MARVRWTVVMKGPTKGRPENKPSSAIPPPPPPTQNFSSNNYYAAAKKEDIWKNKTTSRPEDPEKAPQTDTAEDRYGHVVVPAPEVDDLARSADEAGPDADDGERDTA